MVEQLLVGVAQHLVVGLKKGVLEAIFDDEVAETVLLVAVGVSDDAQPHVEVLVARTIELLDRVPLDQTHKFDGDAVGSLGKEIAREGKVANFEIRRTVQGAEKRARQDDERLVAAECIGLIVNQERGAPLVAEHHRTCIQTATETFKKSEIALADREMLVGKHM